MSDDIDVLIEDIGALTITKESETEGKRASYSTFLITLNPNKSGETDEEEETHCKNLKKLIKWLFRKKRLPLIIKFLNDDEYSSDTIEYIKIKFGVEKGS